MLQNTTELKQAIVNDLSQRFPKCEYNPATIDQMIADGLHDGDIINRGNNFYIEIKGNEYIYHYSSEKKIAYPLTREYRLAILGTKIVNTIIKTQKKQTTARSVSFQQLKDSLKKMYNLQPLTKRN